VKKRFTLGNDESSSGSSSSSSEEEEPPRKRNNRYDDSDSNSSSEEEGQPQLDQKVSQSNSSVTTIVLDDSDEELTPFNSNQQTGNLKQTVNTTINTLQQTLLKVEQKERAVTNELKRIKEKQQLLDTDRQRTIELNRKLEKQQAELETEKIELKHKEKILLEKEKVLDLLILENSLHTHPNWYDFSPNITKFHLEKEYSTYGIFVAYDSTSSRTYISHTGYCEIQMYDKDYNLIKSIGDRQKKDPSFGLFHKQFGLVITSESLVLVNDSGNHRIAVFDSDLNYLRQLPIYSDSSEFALDENENIVILNHGRNESLIEVYSLSGSLLKSIEVSSDISDAKYMHKYALTVHGDKIYICDTYSVKEFSADSGQLLSTINPFPQSHFNQFRPLSITLAQSKNQLPILVIGTINGLIYFFDMNGKYLSHIGRVTDWVGAIPSIKSNGQQIIYATNGDIRSFDLT
jgi:hypothetical protein